MTVADAVEWRAPSGRLRLLRLLEVAACAVIASAIGGTVVVTSSAAAGSVVVGGTLVGAAAVALVAVRRVAAWGYAERADDLVVRRGVVFRRTSVVPYGRMQVVDVTAGPFERALGLASVRLHTAAATSDARIPGLDAAEAARLRDRLSQRGEASLTGL